MKTTGEKIRESRTHLGLTQTELADKIGVTLRTITKYEKQGVMPRGVNLQRLAEVLGVSTAYLSNDEIVDPNYGLEEAPYIESARAAYGRKGATDVEQLLTQTRALFAGGDVPEQDKELFFQAVTEAYFANKQRRHRHSRRERGHELLYAGAGHEHLVRRDGHSRECGKSPARPRVHQLYAHL